MASTNDAVSEAKLCCVVFSKELENGDHYSTARIFNNSTIRSTAWSDQIDVHFSALMDSPWNFEEIYKFAHSWHTKEELRNLAPDIPV